MIDEATRVLLMTAVFQLCRLATRLGLRLGRHGTRPLARLPEQQFSSTGPSRTGHQHVQRESPNHDVPQRRSDDQKKLMQAARASILTMAGYGATWRRFSSWRLPRLVTTGSREVRDSDVGSRQAVPDQIEDRTSAVGETSGASCEVLRCSKASIDARARVGVLLRFW